MAVDAGRDQHHCVELGFVFNHAAPELKDRLSVGARVSFGQDSHFGLVKGFVSFRHNKADRLGAHGQRRVGGF